MMRGLFECLRASLGSVNLVVPGPQVDPQGTDDLRLVVNDEDPGHDGSSPGLGGGTRSAGS